MIDPLTTLYHVPSHALGQIAPSVADPEAARALAVVCLAGIGATALWALGGLAGAAWLYVERLRAHRHHPIGPGSLQRR